ncbi:YozE family protein [Niallia sp. 01092]|uniref:YozE family protein n=1 Tax=unclassified Niallia TaxID=2837522 RepID=UPI003FD1F6BA
MSKSFYHFLMKFRHPSPKDDISEFANNAYVDHGFPKNSSDYEEISSYLELNGHYLMSMQIFDRAWETYLFQEEKNIYFD